MVLSDTPSIETRPEIPGDLSTEKRRTDDEDSGTDDSGEGRVFRRRNRDRLTRIYPLRRRSHPWYRGRKLSGSPVQSVYLPGNKRWEVEGVSVVRLHKLPDVYQNKDVRESFGNTRI